MSKKFYTSYFAKNSKHPKAVSIALSAIKGYRGKAYPELMPTWDLVHAVKENKITEIEYAKKYHELLKERKITVQKIVDDLEDGSVLLCWEAKGFCHRHLISEWLKAAGVDISEL